MYGFWTMSEEQAIGKPRSSSLGGSGPRSRRLILPYDPFYRGHDRSYLLPRIPGGYISKSTLLHDSISRLHGRRGNLVRTFYFPCKQSIRIAHQLYLGPAFSSFSTPISNLRSFESNHTGSNLDPGVERWSVPTSCICPTHISPRLILSHFPLSPPPRSRYWSQKQIKSLERQGYTVLYARDDWSESNSQKEDQSPLSFGPSYLPSSYRLLMSTWVVLE